MLLGVVARAFRRIAAATGFEFTTALGSPTATVAYQGDTASVDVETALGSPFGAKGHQGSAAAYAFDTALGSPTAITGKSGSAEAFAIVTGMGSPTATVAYQGIPADIETVIEVPSIATGYTYTNAEAQTFEDNADGTGWDDTLRGDIDTLISDLKSGRINSSNTYGGFDFIALHNLPNATDSLRWLNSPTTLMTAVNSPTFLANRGYTGDGSSSFIRTGFVPSTDGVNWTLNNASMGVWVRQVISAGSAGVYMGIIGPSGRSYIEANRLGTNNSLRTIGPNTGNTASILSTAASSGVGLLANQRPDESTIGGWFNGVREDTATAITTGNVDSELNLLSRNGTGYADGQISASFAGRSFTANEWADIHDAFNRFYTAREAV